MKIIDIFDIILKHIKILVIIPILCFAASMFYGFNIVKPTYTANTTFMVLNQQYYDTVTYNDLIVGQLLIEDYRCLATSRTVRDDAAKILGVSNLGAYDLSVTGVDNTRVIKLSVTTTNATYSANLCNALTKALCDSIEEIMKVDNVTVIDEAFVPRSKSGPDKKRIVGYSTLAGIVLAVGLVMLLEVSNTTIKTAEDIEKYLNIPVLARINKIEGDE